jgi:predicted nucleotidyltransferase component of viral defense system
MTIRDFVVMQRKSLCKSLTGHYCLHHDILREMSRAGFLKNLTFIGGTCLRACYGSQRLSEDLDFTGGADFTREGLAELGKVLVASPGGCALDY